MSGVSAILAQMAENAGRAQLARGASYANLIAGASAIPGQIMDDRENRAIRAANQARLAAEDRRRGNEDVRRQQDQELQDATAARQLERARVVRAGLLAAVGDSGDPMAFDARAAFATVSRLGQPDAITDVIAEHRKLLPQITQHDPTKDTYTDGVLTRPGSEKPPEIGTPAYEIYNRRLMLLNPDTPPPAAPPAATPPPTDHAGDPSWTRGDGTPKGNGFLGPLPRPDGKVSSEISIGVTINGKETEVPTLVPTLTATERDWLLTHDVSDPATIPDAIVQKATDHAKTRIAAGKSPFAGPDESPAAAAPRLTPQQATAQAYADQRAASKPPVDPHSPIYKEWTDYTNQGGTLGFEAYMNADANRRRPVVNVSGLGKMYDEIDPKAIAAQIRAGKHPPDISQYGRPASAAIASALAQKGPNGEAPFDLSSAQREWTAQKNLNRTMNGAQQVRLDESIRSGLAMYDKVDELAAKWDGKGWGPLSRINLAAAREGLKGKEAQSIANQLTGQIGQLTSDVATIEQGGLTPTNEARAIAEQSMQAWWGKGTITDMTAQGRYNMQIRHLARNTQDAFVPGNPADRSPAIPATPAGGPPPPAAPITVTSPSGRSFPFADQAAADAFVADAKAKGLWK